MRRNTTLTIFVSTALIATIAFVANMTSTVEPAHAQDQLPPPVPDRISFGSVGLTAGQTLRVTVANTIMPSDVNLPPGPVRVVMNFRLANGNLARDSRTGDVIRKIVDLARGDSSFVDLDYSDLPPGPVRVQLRPVVVSQPPPVGDSNQNPYPRDAIVPTVEIVNNANGRTQFAVFTHPAVARGFNPQPDPPSPSE
jgi:hypothetical protein